MNSDLAIVALFVFVAVFSCGIRFGVDIERWHRGRKDRQLGHTLGRRFIRR